MSRKDIFEHARSKGYLLAKIGKTDALENEYYKWCEERNIPLIKAYVEKKYTQVSINLDTTSYVLNEECQRRIASLYRRYTGKPSSVGKGPLYCVVDDVPNESVDTLIMELRQIYEDCKMDRAVRYE